MKYFAMIEGRQYGPMTLDDMVKEGVRPDTYVWCKGMDDWRKASDVADICRYFRQRLAGELPSQKNMGMISDSAKMVADEIEQEELLNRLPPMTRNIVRKSGVKLTKENFPERPQSSFPKALPVILFILSVLVMIFGFLLL